jgi:type I restriction enzyme R subunit
MGKAMVVSIDKLTAVKMYLKVQDAWKKYMGNLQSKLAETTGAEANAIEIKLRYMKETDMAVVVSPSQNEIDDFHKKVLISSLSESVCKMRIWTRNLKSPIIP